MKNGGFSLIEVTVAIALIGVMMGIGIPKFRNQMALGRDTKAVAILTTLRTAGELYYLETGKTLTEGTTGETQTVEALKKLENYLDTKTFKEIEDGKIEIGGSRAKKSDVEEADENIVFGGEIGFTFTNPEENKASDGIYIWFDPTGIGEYDTKGNLWTEY